MADQAIRRGIFDMTSPTITGASDIAHEICSCANRDQHKRDVALLNSAFAAHCELGAQEEREAIVRYLRSQAATALMHDLPLMEGADKKRLDFIIVAVEKYADSIERGEYLTL